MWRRHILPLFTVIGGILLIVFVVVRTGRQGHVVEDFVPARNGLLAADGSGRFDPALAVLSPIELALAPDAPVFLDSPFAPEIGTEPDAILAVADGLVIHAGPRDAVQTVILLHRRGQTRLETVYTGLDTLRVTVGAQVRRGQAIGTLAVDARARFRFEHRPSPGLAADPVAGAGSDLPREWRGRGEDQISDPPVGARLAPSIQLEAPAR